MRLSLKKPEGPARAFGVLRASRTGIRKANQHIKKGMSRTVIGSDEQEETEAKEYMTYAERKAFSKLSSRKRRSFLKKEKQSHLNYSVKTSSKSIEAAAGASTGGALTAARTVKRTAARFRESLEEASVIRSQSVQKMKEEAENRFSTGRTSSGVRKGFLFISGAALMIAAQALSFVLIILNTILVGLAAILPFIVLIAVVAAIVVVLYGGLSEQERRGNYFVQVVSQEYSDSNNNIGGHKYKTWYGMDSDWCAMFISWCSEQCDYINEGIMPRTASVSAMRNWYEARGLYHEKGGYTPRAGDIIFFQHNMSHVGVVIEYDNASRTVTTIEGNSGSSNAVPYHSGSRVTKNTYSISYSCISGYAAPEYPEAEVIEIPGECGTVYSYMGWQTITSPSSKQYQLREQSGGHFDGNGFAKIGDRYVIACTTKFGQVGDYIDWELENGTVIHSVIGDIKNQNDAGCNEWGHKYGACVIEFVVDKNTWYGTNKYPTHYHPEWASKTVAAVKAGSYW